ncbi:MAG: Lrp/AsnC family transcriptional regulator [Bacteroidota bacterium]
MLPIPDFALLNNFQRDFPLVTRPFQTLALVLGSTEEAVLHACRRYQAAGVIGRIGAVFAPRRVGASTLAALAVPPAELARVAALVSAQPGVNHNYAREHRYNLWFVVTAPDAAELAAILAGIESQSGCPLLTLPLEDEFHIDLGFDLSGAGQKCGDGVPSTGGESPCALSGLERQLMSVLQEGLPLVAAPFRKLADQLGLHEAMLIEMIADWLETGIIKRFGIVLRHHELGYTANAMCVWDVPDALVAALGRQLAEEAAVTLCYRRRRAGEAWPYNLYCMIHGKARAEVLATRAAIAARLGLDAWPQQVLFSVQRFKQQGACYASAMTDETRRAIHGECQ